MPTTAISSTSDEPDLPFRFVAGHPALDLVNTADWTSEGTRRDRLARYDRFLDWALEARMISPAHRRSLWAAAKARPLAATRALALAHHARSVLQRLTTALARSDSTGPALAELNHLLEGAAGRVRLANAARHRLERTWDGIGIALESPLWPVIWAAADLFVSDQTERISVCAGTDCGWVYLDTSRAATRRWCEMTTCGTAAKNRRRAVRARRR